MKIAKKLLSVVLTVCMVLMLLPMTALADEPPVTIGTTGYSTLTDALTAAANGDVIKLNDNITESVSYTVYADKTITIDGGGYMVTGTAATNAALALNGTGTAILKNLTVQGGASASGISEGLDVSGSVSVQSYGTVTANGGAANVIYGVINQGTGTVDVTEASAAGGSAGYGTFNTGSGTINVGTAMGSGAMSGAGAFNKGGGTINVMTASGNRNGVTNLSSGTVNVTTAISTNAGDPVGSAIFNGGAGTVNVGTVSGAVTGVSNQSTGTVNAGTITGTTTNSGSGTVNTGTDVTVVPLHVGTEASCVLNLITIANSGSTIGTLPDVYKGSECSAEWYTGVALSNLFTMQEISPEATLYSSFYTIETPEDVAAYITEVSGLTAGASGGTVTVTGTATLTTASSDAALTINIPADDMTVVWKAALSGGGSKYLLELTGDGTFEVADGANIVNTACQAAIYCYDGTGNLNVTGGKVSTTVGNGMAIGIAGGWLLTMTGGEVAANAADSGAIFGKNPVVVMGGTVSATGTGGCQLYMGETSVYRSGVLDPGKIMYHDSGVFAEVCVGAAVTQAQPGTSTGLTVTGHNLSAGDSVTAVWAKQKGGISKGGISVIYISYYSAKDPTNAVETWLLVVPGVTVTTAYTVTYNKNGGDTEAIPATKTVAPGESVGTLPTAPTRSGYTFTGWNTASDGSGAAFTASVIVKSDITVYAQWSKNSDAGSGGNGGGGGGSAPTNPTTKPPTTPTTNPTTTVSGSRATTLVTPTVSGGVATGAVTESQMSDALAKAKAAAGTNGTPDMEIQISGASGASSIGTTIPHASMQALVSGGASMLTISGPTGSVSFGADALKTISGAASGDVTVTVAETDSSTLSEAAQALVGSHPVFTFSVTSGGKAISQFGGDVTVSIPYTPAAGEDTNAIVIYYINANGTPTLVPDARYDAATGTVVFNTTHFSTYAVVYNKVSFTDVSNTAWYEDAVTFLAARGVTSGATATTFNPDATLTRGQFITMLLRAYGISADTNPTGNFANAGKTYYTGYLAAAKRLGISTGVGNNMFVPEKAITRQEMFTLLYNALKMLDKLPSGTSGKTLSDFTDASGVASWATDAMTALVKAGTVTGSNGKLNPTSTTTRAEMVQVLYNLLGK